jgi:hypothetical protein
MLNGANSHLAGAIVEVMGVVCRQVVKGVNDWIADVDPKGLGGNRRGELSRDCRGDCHR